MGLGVLLALIAALFSSLKAIARKHVSRDFSSVEIAGAYILVAKESLITPIENLKNKGALITILVAFLLAVYSIAQRFGATNADPLLFVYISYLTSLIGFWIWKRKESENNIEVRSYFRKDIFALGTVTALGVVAGIFAYSMISASEVTVIKQSSAVFGVLIGGRLFKEDDLTRKLIGAVIIGLGVLLVTI